MDFLFTTHFGILPLLSHPDHVCAALLEGMALLCSRPEEAHVDNSQCPPEWFFGLSLREMGLAALLPLDVHPFLA